MNEPPKTEVRLRFRINMLLAERDMSLKQLYERVKQLGSDISSSHFYRQMKPYHSPMRMDLLTLVVRALKVQPSELFDLVEVEVDEDRREPQAVAKADVVPGRVDDALESEQARKAREAAKKKRVLTMLGTKIKVDPAKKT